MKRTLAFLLFAALATTACKKDKDPATTTEPAPLDPDFTATGELYVHRPVLFRSNLKEETFITWYFGSTVEMTLKAKEVNYAFPEPGTYTVTMAVNGGQQGTAQKNVTITNGTSRMSGKYKWYFFLVKNKTGFPLDHFPTQSFEKEMSLDVLADDSTIKIPDISQIRHRGPYTVKLKEVTADKMYLANADHQVQASYDVNNQRGGIKIIQVSNDTTWTLTGYANIVK